MAITISVQAEDRCSNKIYFILENGHWRAMSQSGTPESLSYSSSNAAELYIALANSECKSDAIRAINKHGDYLKKDSAK